MHLKPVFILIAALLAVFGHSHGMDQLAVVYKTTAQGPLKLDLHYPTVPKA